MTSRVTDRHEGQDVGSPLGLPLFLTLSPLYLSLFTNDDAEVGVTFTSALIALIVSYLIGVGGGRGQ